MSILPPEPVEIDPSFVPTTEAELAMCLASWRWRLFSGALYRIIVKGEEGQPTTSMPFIPNASQTEFLLNLHNRNVVLKARQLGITTAACINTFDHAMFNAEQRCGIIAHTLPDAETIFADKIKFTYDNMPESLRAEHPLANDTGQMIRFANNNSTVRVATSMRSGTIHRLHVSEMGKIGKESPKKAREIVTGSLQAVPIDGVAVIESTAEGQEGEFYKIASRAEALKQERKQLSKAEYRFFFFPWFKEPKYRLDPATVRITQADHAYFDKIEKSEGVKLDDWQRAFYVSKRETDLSGDVEKMWQEWPSTSEECWQRSTEGTFYAAQLARARIEGRITVVPHVARVPVNTFWDIGSGDGTAIWLHQYIGMQHRIIGFMEGWSEGYAHYVNRLRATGYVFGGMFLPHDAVQTRQMANTIASPLDMLMELAPDWKFHIVPRVQVLQHGIDLTRSIFSQLWFDRDACAAGIEHLSLYRKKWNSTLGVWSDEPDKDNPHTEAADALRQLAQGFDPALVNAQTRPTRRNSGRFGASVL